MSVRTVLVVLAVSLVVGLLMTTIGVSPGDVYEAGAVSIVRAGTWLKELIGGSWGKSLLAGASVVVPVWLVVYLIRRRWRRGR